MVAVLNGTIGRPSRPKRLLAFLLAGTCLSPVGVAAQTWVGATGSYNTTSNWNPATIPNTSAATAIFTNTGTTAISLNNIGALQVGTFQFNNTAQAYTFDVSGGTTLQFNGSGIVNNSAVAQTINMSGTGSLQFRVNSSLGNATINVDGSSLNIDGAGVTGGTATINTNDDINLGTATNLQNATVNLTESARLRFVGGTATGGQATVNMLSADSVIRFNGYGGTGTTIGSLAGSGEVSLTDVATSANKTLTIGGNNQSTVFSGRIVGGGSIVKEGTGVLTLSGNSSYTGGTTISDAGGGLAVGSNNALGTGGLTMANGSSLRATASVTLANAVTLSGVNVFDSQANILTLNGAIGGAGAVSKAGTGTLNLNGANSYTSSTALDAGTLGVGNNAALGTGALLMADNTTLRANASVNLANNITLFGAGTVDTQANSLTLSGVISGAGGIGDLTKNGTGTLNLSGSNTYAGGTTLNAGTLGVGNSSALGTGALSMAGGTTLQANANVTLGNAITLNGAGTVNTQANSLTLSGAIDGAGALTKTGAGTLTLSGAKTYSGGTAINGGTLSISNNNNLGAAGTALSVDGGTLAITAGLSVSNRTITLNAGGGTFDVVGGATLRVGTITGSGGLTKNGNGSLFLTTDASDYTGATTINAGRFAVDSPVDNVFSSRSAFTVASGARISLAGTDQAIGSLAGGGTVDNIAGAGSPSILTAGGDNTSTLFSGVLQNGNAGALGLTKAGTGTMTLSGANTYSGATTVSTGTLQAGAANSFSANSAHTVDAGATLALNNFNQTIGSLAGAGAVTLGTATLAAGGNNASTIYSGVVSGSGGVTKQGTGTLTLTGTNTYGGATTVSGGTLVFTGDTSVLTGNMAVAGGANVTFDQAVNRSYAGVISDGGSVTKSGTGTMTLGGGNTYGGTTTVNAGTLAFTGDTSGLGGNMAVATGANITFDQATDSSFAGAISGDGSVTKSGAGTFTLSGNSSYQGGTTLNVGTLAVGDSSALGTGTLTFANSTTLQAAADGLSLNNAMTLNGAGTIDTQGNSLTLAGQISGTGGSLTKAGSGTLALTGNNSYGGGTTINEGTLQLGDGVTQGTLAGAVTVNAAIFDVVNANTSGITGIVTNNGGTTQFSGATTAPTATLTVNDGGLLNFLDSSGAGGATINTNDGGQTTFAGSTRAGSSNLTTSGSNAFLFFQDTSTAETSTIAVTNSATVQFLQSANAGTASIAASSSGGVSFFDSSRAGGATIVASGGGAISFINSATADTATLTANAGGSLDFFDSGSAGTASLTANNNGNITFQNTSTADGSTITVNSGGRARFFDTSSGGTARFVANAGGTVNFNNLSSAGTTAGSIEGAGNYVLGSKSLTVGSNNLSTTASGVISGNGGSLVKVGTGTLILTGANTYTGGTTVSGGTLQGNTSSLRGAITNNAAVVFDQATSGTYTGSMTGTGSFTKTGAGLLNLTGTNSVGGGTSIIAGTLAVNGSLTSNVTVGSGGTLGGSGTIAGLVTSSGTMAPGNSIGTLNVNGSFVQNGGIYQVEVNAAGQSDRINVTGAPGTATINGGTVQVIAQQGAYARRTTYTILNAAGGVTGTYSNVTSDFAFLTPTLSYDANNVFLTLFQSNSAFAAGAQTPNQFAVGTALDRANASATGDFNTVLNALSSLNTAQGPAALDAISGQNYSGFGTANVQGGLAFMNVLGQQMSLARGGSGGGTRVALAQACDVTCDGEGEQPSGFSVWGSAIGGTGSVAGSGNGNSATLTYNLGGFAAGVDYRLDPRFLVGLGLGYASGNQWLGGFNGRGTSTSYNASLYASFTPGAFYLDALAGYGYNDNQMTRMIAIPGLASRTAMGQTGANQFLGQAEAGYRFNVYAPAAASLTPFARFQTTSVNQAAFTETGANSLNLSVAQQTTTSVRTVLGAELSGALDMGWREKLALQLRLGWAHEYADTSRPVTASFAGAPGIGFTVYGAPPQRDGAVIGLAANTAIADRTSIYLRYDGELGTGTDNHVLSAGVRMSW